MADKPTINDPASFIIDFRAIEPGKAPRRYNPLTVGGLCELFTNNLKTLDADAAFYKQLVSRHQNENHVEMARYYEKLSESAKRQAEFIHRLSTFLRNEWSDRIREDSK